MVCVEQDNISRQNDEYRVNEVLTSKNLNQALPKAESDYPIWIIHPSVPMTR